MPYHNAELDTGYLPERLKRRRDTWDLGLSPSEWLYRRSEQLQKTVERNAYQNPNVIKPINVLSSNKTTSCATSTHRGANRRPLSPSASTPESLPSTRSVTPMPPTPESQDSLLVYSNDWLPHQVTDSARDHLQRMLFMSTLTQNEHDMLAGCMPTINESVTIDKLLKGMTVRRSTVCGFNLSEELEDDTCDVEEPEPLLHLEEFLDMTDCDSTIKEEQEDLGLQILDGAIVIPSDP